MIAFGIVSEVDTAKGLARVNFEEDGIVSDWLPIVQKRTKGTTEYTLPEKGEHVACLMDKHHEDGVVMGAIYNETDKPKSGLTGDDFRIDFKDGGYISYNTGSGLYKVSAKQTATITSEKDINLNAPSGKIAGTSNGDLQFTSSTGGTFGAKGTGIVIKNSTGSLKVQLLNLLDQLAAETHGTLVGPTTPPVNSAAYLAIKAIITTIFSE